MDSFAKTRELLGERCLGILGAGHLGRALAAGLIASGFPASHLLVCHRGSQGTRSALEREGLARRSVDILELGDRSAVVLITLRPQDVAAVAGCPIRPDTLLVSCVAGIGLHSLLIPGPPVRRARVMPSAPATIERRNGIAGVFPSGDAVIDELLSGLGLVPFSLRSEDDFHVFTAFGPCLPIALASWRRLGKEVDEQEIGRLAAEQGLPDHERILDWALSLSSDGNPAEDGDSLDGFLASAATRGGVAEAILDVIADGGSLTEALLAGVRRSRWLQDALR